MSAAKPDAELVSEVPLGPLESVLVLLVFPLAGVAWVGLISAHAGRLSPGLAASSGAAILIALSLLLFGPQARVRRNQAMALSDSGASGRWSEAAILLVALALVARLLPLGTPWPAYLDASFYMNSAARIVEEGGLEVSAPALDAPRQQARQFVATFGDHLELGLPFPDNDGLGFYDVVYAVDLGQANASNTRGAPAASAKSSVSPYHPPIFASYLALWGRILGLDRMPLGLLPWALVYLLAVASLALRAYGRSAALLALALIGLGPSFAYHGGNPYAELMAGALLLCGIWILLFLDRTEGPAPALAFGAGLLLGLSALTKIDVWPAVGIATLSAIVLRRSRADTRERQGLALGLGLPLLHLAILSLGPSRLYMGLNLGGVGALLVARLPELALLAMAFGLLLLGWRARGGQFASLPGKLVDRPARVALGLLLVLCLALVSLDDGFRGDDALPSMFAISAWAITPLGLWAAAAGLVLALESGAARMRPLLVLGLSALPLVMVAPVVTRSLSSLYTLRRLAPLALPLFAIFAAGAAVQLAGRPTSALPDPDRIDQDKGSDLRSSAADWLGRFERDDWIRILVASFASWLVLLGSHQAAKPFVGAPGRDFVGGQALIERIAAYGEPDDVFLFGSAIGGNQAGRLAAPMRNLKGMNALQIGPRVPDVEALGAWVSDRLSSGNSVLMVLDAEQDVPDIAGFEFESLGEEALVTRAPSPNPQLPPIFTPLSFNLRVFALVEATGDPDIGH